MDKLNLRGIDPRILKLRQLTVLEMSKNRLKILPRQLSDLPLKQLNLSSNQIDSLPPYVADGPWADSLIYLDLSDNQITHLPEDMWSCASLRSLKVSQNKLIGLPCASFARHRHIMHIHAQNNQMNCLPLAMTKQLKLATFDLSNNPFSNLATDPNSIPIRVSLCGDLISLKNLSSLQLVRSKK
ncbi:hypothetical protein Ciccas_000616 [Cichlidogyrus casuarinus]|uniref:Uncharacterized protein n=1 Tax=Cichlidogyrus casuarinus TaxID=1844966 RepID=A0ABD2QME3_9PLAT